MTHNPLPDASFIAAFRRPTRWYMPEHTDEGLIDHIPVYPIGWVSPTRVVVADALGREYTVRWDTLRRPEHARPEVKA